MAYILYGTRPLIFCANPRTGSTAMAQALQGLGAELTGPGHHGQPRFIPEDAVVFQEVRDHLEVINSFWWKSRPTGDFSKLVRLVCRGEYAHLGCPRMYERQGITHTIDYHRLTVEFRLVCNLAGVAPPKLVRTPSRTQRQMFTTQLAQQVRETYAEELREFNFVS